MIPDDCMEGQKAWRSDAYTFYSIPWFSAVCISCAFTVLPGLGESMCKPRSRLRLWKSAIVEIVRHTKYSSWAIPIQYQCNCHLSTDHLPATPESHLISHLSCHPIDQHNLQPRICISKAPLSSKYLSMRCAYWRNQMTARPAHQSLSQHHMSGSCTPAIRITRMHARIGSRDVEDNIADL